MNTLPRRARPLLGTLVEVACDGPRAAFEAAFEAVAAVQCALSRFEAAGDVGRFNAAPAGAAVPVGADAQVVLAAATRLAACTQGRFDVALGSGRWHLDDRHLVKLDATTRLDLGGIAKGHAVDRAVDALRAAGASGGWVNAGGDLRCFGEPGVEIALRDETAGGVRRFGRLHDGAFATSRLQAFGAPGPRHVSVAAPRCLWADALTKLAALGLPLPPEAQARAWVHA